MVDVVEPRFEFRSFGQDLSAVGKRMAALTGPVPEAVVMRHSDEIYIISQDNDVNNTKIRGGKMDIKTLLTTVDGLEQWDPLLKGEFPISVQLLEEQVFPALQVAVPAFAQPDYSLAVFLKLTEDHPELRVVEVHKQRFGYRVNDTICEYAHVLIDGLKLDTITVESIEIEDIKKTRIDLELTDLENINYLQAIKRVIGMIDKPLAN